MFGFVSAGNCPTLMQGLVSNLAEDIINWIETTNCGRKFTWTSMGEITAQLTYPNHIFSNISHIRFRTVRSSINWWIEHSASGDRLWTWLLYRNRLSSPRYKSVTRHRVSRHASSHVTPRLTRWSVTIVVSIIRRFTSGPLFLFLLVFFQLQ